jgi:uncharacterized alpha-E superfamily protein
MTMTLQAPPRRPAPNQHLLARYAEGMLWLARYVERIENLARMLDITHTFSQDAGAREGDNWLAVLRINGDLTPFFERHGEPSLRTVGHFYLLDRGNPTSIPASIEAARENARTLRALISTEMWVQVNVFHNRIRALTAADLVPERFSRLCAALKEGCQAHAGIAEGTAYRDQSWRFYTLGRYLERADQTTRLVDVGYHSARPEDAGEAAVAQWITLLRSAAGYHAYRRVHPAGFSIAEMIHFMLQDRAFPRSVALSLEQVDRQMATLTDRHGLPLDGAAEGLHGLRALLDGESIAGGLGSDLSPLLDRIQAQIGELYAEIAKAVLSA